MPAQIEKERLGEIINSIVKERMTRRKAIGRVATVGVMAALTLMVGGSYYAGQSSESLAATKATNQISGTQRVQSIARASLPVTIPLGHGFYKGEDVFFITTEASDNSLADVLTSRAGFRVVYAPILSRAPPSSTGDAFVFSNGLKGDGLLGFQSEVFNSVPGNTEYSPAREIKRATWKEGINPFELRSVEEIRDAASSGKLTIERTGIIVNSPAIKWPSGQMKLADASEVNDDTTYGSAQLLSIDTVTRRAVFKAHRCWAQDGSQVYYIVTDASLDGPSGDLGAVFAPRTHDMLKTQSASDFFVFVNGIKGPGPMGFQSSIGGSKPGDEIYSPFWRINAVSWKDPSKSTILESLADLSAFVSSLKIEPMMGGLNVNCPFVEVR